MINMITFLHSFYAFLFYSELSLTNALFYSKCIAELSVVILRELIEEKK